MTIATSSNNANSASETAAVTSSVVTASSGLASAVSQSELKYILQGCRDDCRVDGRRRNEFRPYSIVVNDICLSYGSARVFLPSGSTHIIVSVRAELVIPPSTPLSTSASGGRNEEGVIEVHVDFMHGNNRAAEDDLESTLSSLLVPHLVDRKALCVSPDHYVWKLSIDVLVVASGGGSLVDACSLGIKAALRRTLLPKITLVSTDTAKSKSVEGGSNTDVSSTVDTTTKTSDGRPTIQVDSDIRSAQPIPGISSNEGDDGDMIPTIVTVSVLRDDQKSPLFIVDATGEEECCSFAQVHVVLQQPRATGGAGTRRTKSSSRQHHDNHNDTEPVICALHKAGGGAVPFGILQDVTACAIEASSSMPVVMKESQSLYHILQDNFDLQ